jgi:hypothetical protein
MPLNRRWTRCRVGLALSGGLAAIVLGTAVGPATAKPPERGHRHGVVHQPGANDKTFTNVFTQVNKDLKVTDNGDGTLTIPGMGAGMSKYLGPDGFLFLDAGQFRFEVLIDHGGTPTDPSDDEEIEGTFRVVRDLTGRNDTEGCDFCDDIHEFIG